MDWKAQISRVIYWKQLAASSDPKQALPWHLPSVAADAESVAKAEDITGILFSNEYKDFLSHADGWKGFYITTDLFGTKDFLSGRFKSVLQRPELLHFLNENFNESMPIPIGSSDYDLDVFLHFSPESKILPGGVLWFANEEVERYETFSDFFSSMVGYSERIAKKMAGKL